MARTKGGVVFVPKVLPEELVEVEIVDRKKDYANARLLEILEASASRKEPACPNFHTVGCCSWDHIDYKTQLALKEDIIRESLKRLGHIQFERSVQRITGAPEGYRLRAGFHVIDRRLGFVQEKSHRIVPISSCTALMPGLNQFIGEANRALMKSKYQNTDSVRAIISPDTGEVGASFRSGRHRTAWTNEAPRVRILKTEFRLRPDSFFQPNRYLLENMASEVVDTTKDSRLILELFCGSGFFSLLVARKATSVVGVDRRSVSNAEWNASRNGITNVDFVRASALSFLMNSRFEADTLVVDPPRTGMGKTVVGRILALAPTRIVYVACNPATFAAEARFILDGDYDLTSLKFIDQFPNNPHIETIAVFDRV